MQHSLNEPLACVTLTVVTKYFESFEAAVHITKILVVMCSLLNRNVVISNPCARMQEKDPLKQKPRLQSLLFAIR